MDFGGGNNATMYIFFGGGTMQHIEEQIGGVIKTLSD
jgi:hypothetical protein